MRSRRFSGWMLGMGILCLGSGSVRADRPIKPDSGKFLLTINGSEVGTDTFSITADGGSKGDVKLSVGQTKVTISSLVKAVKNRLTEITTTAEPGGKFTLTLNGTKGKFRGEGNGQKVEKDVPVALPSYPFGNYMPHLLVNALAAYDAARKGGQEFDLILADNAVGMKGTLSVKGEKTYKVKGKPVKTTRYTLSDLGNKAISPQAVTLELLVDSERRLLLWYVPSQNYSAVRDGYQDLMKAARADLSQ